MQEHAVVVVCSPVRERERERGRGREIPGYVVCALSLRAASAACTDTVIQTATETGEEDDRPIPGEVSPLL